MLTNFPWAIRWAVTALGLVALVESHAQIRPPSSAADVATLAPQVESVTDRKPGLRQDAVDVIISCDPGWDPDDMSDLAIAQILQQAGELRILALVMSHTNQYTGPLAHLMTRYYGNPEIPIGVPSASAVVGDAFGAYTMGFFPALSEGAPPNALQFRNATSLMRQILAGRPNGSVKLLCTGQMRNLYDLLASTGDSYSALNGVQLVDAKCSEIIIVAGIFPSTGTPEYNFQTDITAAQRLNTLTDAGITVTYVGIELGNAIVIPTGGISQLPYLNPVRISHAASPGYTTRPSWAGLGLLYAARGLAYNGTNLFAVASTGTITVDGAGANTWTASGGANQRYLSKSQADSFYINELDRLLLARPYNQPEALHLNSRSDVIALSFGDNDSGLRRSGADEIEWLINNVNVGRLWEGGIALRGGNSSPNSWPIGLYIAQGALGGLLDAGLVRDTTGSGGGMRVVGDTFNNPGRARAREFLAADGSATQPAFTFAGHTNTGIFYGGTDELRITYNGTEKQRIWTEGFLVAAADGFYWTSGAIDSGTVDTGLERVSAGVLKITGGIGAAAGVLRVASGVVGTPTLSFDGDTDTGIYRSAADQVSVTVGGTERFRVPNTGTITVLSGLAPDTGNSRDLGTSGLTWKNIFHEGKYLQTTDTISGTDIDWSLGNTFNKSISGNTTFTFSNAAAGQWITVKITASGANTVTWPTVTWKGASTPTQTASKTDFYTFYYDGTTYFGSASQNF